MISLLLDSVFVVAETVAAVAGTIKKIKETIEDV